MRAAASSTPLLGDAVRDVDEVDDRQPDDPSEITGRASASASAASSASARRLQDALAED